ncbi:MAG TPA: PilT/PilU family type 4a pilus ATPase [Acidimicrobiia bacterium]
MLDIDHLLRLAVEERASDVHLKVGARPHLRVDGALAETSLDVLEPADTEHAAELLLGRAAGELVNRGEVDAVHAVQALGRFRVSAFKQRGFVGVVLRRVVPGMPSIDSLGLPPAATQMAECAAGFVLVCGLAGSGRTSTLAAMVDHINETRRCHVVTIESPVEVVYGDKLSVIDQRDVGIDTTSVLAALRAASHQDPDVVVVGALPDSETTLAALESADAGRLVLGVTQAVGAVDAVGRLVDSFPPAQRAPARSLLARTLRGVLCQRLVPRAGGRGRVPAVEVLTVHGPAAAAIADADGGAKLEALIADGEFYGMQTFDQSLATLYRRGLVNRDDALANSVYEPGLAVMLDGADRERAATSPASPSSPSPVGAA